MSGGVPRDGIPALTDPPLVGPDEVDYLSQNSRVIGLVVPHNILWWHEIVNFNFAEVQLAVTYCPLTGSSMAFGRAVVGGAEFGVSGLLFQNNLTMYDRTSEESLWPLYAMGWTGYRWRGINEEAAWKPGDERFAFVAAGGAIGAFSWKLAAEGWWGHAPRIQGIRIVSARREMVQLMPGVGWRLGPGAAEIGGRFPVAGRNLPAGPAVFLGYFTRWNWP